ncbi:MAG: hypothetical protein EXS47_00185 [Candidatus Zambryskibacteria bacterium]|nr:hypothetical protein [Candidatus Zambryskibacteria bacterium]
MTESQTKDLFKEVLKGRAEVKTLLKMHYEATFGAERRAGIVSLVIVEGDFIYLNPHESYGIIYELNVGVYYKKPFCVHNVMTTEFSLEKF